MQAITFPDSYTPIDLEHPVPLLEILTVVTLIQKFIHICIKEINVVANITIILHIVIHD